MSAAATPLEGRDLTLTALQGVCEGQDLCDGLDQIDSTCSDHLTIEESYLSCVAVECCLP